MIVCCPGANYRLAPTAISSLGGLVGSIIDEAQDPPPVLCITKMSQVESIYLALDPDLALIWGFSYKITQRLLSHRSRFVNFHPAPLPLMRGPMPFPRMVMDSTIPLTATWHYMAEGMDQGPIIWEVEMTLPAGVSRGTMTTADIENAATEACFSSIESVLKLVEDGQAGVEQGPGGEVDSWAARYMTDHERTIKDEMSLEEVLRLSRAVGATKPFVKFSGGLYHVLRMSRLEVEDAKPEGTQERMGLDIIQYFKDGAIRMTIRKI